MKSYFPKLRDHIKLVSSTPVRNIATIAGNFVNASPIGDLTAFFIGLNADLELQDQNGELRTLKLKDLFLDYKVLDMREDEIIARIFFDPPKKNTFFNFEKVSKRRYLDIATVNSAMSITVRSGKISEVHLSAGGVGPTPLFLKGVCDFLVGKTLDPLVVREAAERIVEEINPISDARGSKEYKALLLRQMFYAHFNELFPEKMKVTALI